MAQTSPRINIFMLYLTPRASAADVLRSNCRTSRPSKVSFSEEIAWFPIVHNLFSWSRRHLVNFGFHFLEKNKNSISIKKNAGQTKIPTNQLIEVIVFKMYQRLKKLEEKMAGGRELTDEEKLKLRKEEKEVPGQLIRSLFQSISVFRSS